VVLWLIRDIILLLILALILASAMDPVIDYLKQKKIPRTASVLAVYVLVLGSAALIVYLMVPPVLSQFEVLRQHAPEFSQSVQIIWEDLSAPRPSVIFFIACLTSAAAAWYRAHSGVNGVWVYRVLVIAFYLVAAENGMKSFVGTLIPEQQQEFTLTLIKKIQDKMGKWVLGQLFNFTGIFVFTLVGLLLLKVQYALVLALLAGLLEIVPYIGRLFQLFRPCSWDLSSIRRWQFGWPCFIFLSMNLRHTCLSRRLWKKLSGLLTRRITGSISRL